MTVATSPALRRSRLARHLLRLREASGLTAKQAAERAKKLSPDRSWFEAKVTRIETRKILRVRDVDLLTLLDVYGVTDEAERESYLKLARDAAKPGWWSSYRDVLGSGLYVDFENEASRIRSYQSLHLPGLLQTEAYARALFQARGLAAEEVERGVEVRMMRQHILSRSDAPRLWFAIDESAFRKIPREIAAEQVRSILDLSPSGCRVQLVLDEAGPHAAMDGSFSILDFPEDPSVVYAGYSGGSAPMMETPEQLRSHENVFESVQDSALSESGSRDWMLRYAEQFN